MCYRLCVDSCLWFCYFSFIISNSTVISKEGRLRSPLREYLVPWGFPQRDAFGTPSSGRRNDNIFIISFLSFSKFPFHFSACPYGFSIHRNKPQQATPPHSKALAAFLLIGFAGLLQSVYQDGCRW